MRADVCLSFSRHLSRRGPPRALRDEHRRRQREGGPPGKGPPPGYRGPGNPRDGFPPGTTRDVETIPSVTSFVARGEGSRNAPTPRRADSFAAAVTSDCLTYSSHPHCAGAKRGLKVPLLPRGMKMNFRTQKGVMSFPFHSCTPVSRYAVRLTTSFVSPLKRRRHPAAILRDRRRFRNRRAPATEERISAHRSFLWHGIFDRDPRGFDNLGEHTRDQLPLQSRSFLGERQG